MPTGNGSFLCDWKEEIAAYERSPKRKQRSQEEEPTLDGDAVGGHKHYRAGGGAEGGSPRAVPRTGYGL
jgi:hypothetical protein